MANSTGRFEKVLKSFTEGICDLTDISFSAGQSIEHGLQDAEIGYLYYTVIDRGESGECEFETRVPYWSSITPEIAIAACAVNSMEWLDRGNPAIGITQFTVGGCEYGTSRGVVFGWELLEHTRFTDEGMVGKYRFWIIHPDEDKMEASSTLRKSALEQGWTEVFVER